MREYHNPILPGFNPDPSICRHEGDYYLSTSSFWYYPMLPIYHSRDLINWTLVNHAIKSEKQGYRIEEGCRNGIFAPTLRYNEALEKYFIVSCYNDPKYPDRRAFMISADSPEKDWSAPVFLNSECCDPSLFFDNDNRTYVQYITDLQDNVYQYEIDSETGKALSPSIAIWAGTGGRRLEAPHIYHIGKYYYLIAAEGGTETGHYISIARSDNVNGPFESCPSNPILTHRDRKAEYSPIQCVGHGDLIQAPDSKWWLVCLAIRPIGPHGSKKEVFPLGRETFLAPVEWSIDGWPIVKNPGNPDGTLSLITRPEREMPGQMNNASWHDDFTDEQLDINWYFLRTPQTQFWDLHEKPGYLKLTGMPVRMGDWSSPALICRRQKDFDFNLIARMFFHPLHENDEAGLLVFSNDDRHYEIGIKKHEGKNLLFLRRTVLNISEEKILSDWQSDEIFLSLNGDRDKYLFKYGNTQENLVDAGTGTTTLIIHPWTGNHFGPYAVSEKQTAVYFDWIRYTALKKS